MKVHKNKKLSNALLPTILCLLLFIAAPGTLPANTDGEPPIHGEIIALSKNTLTLLVTEKTDADFRPGESVTVRVNRNTRIMNLELKFISPGGLSPGDPVAVSPFAFKQGEVIADMIHLRRKK